METTRPLHPAELRHLPALFSGFDDIDEGLRRVIRRAVACSKRGEGGGEGPDGGSGRDHPSGPAARCVTEIAAGISPAGGMVGASDQVSCVEAPPFRRPLSVHQVAAAVVELSRAPERVMWGPAGRRDAATAWVHLGVAVSRYLCRAFSTPVAGVGTDRSSLSGHRDDVKHVEFIYSALRRQLLLAHRWIHGRADPARHAPGGGGLPGGGEAVVAPLDALAGLRWASLTALNATLAAPPTLVTEGIPATPKSSLHDLAAGLSLASYLSRDAAAAEGRPALRQEVTADSAAHAELRALRNVMIALTSAATDLSLASSRETCTAKILRAWYFSRVWTAAGVEVGGDTPPSDCAVSGAPLALERFVTASHRVIEPFDLRRRVGVQDVHDVTSVVACVVAGAAGLRGIGESKALDATCARLVRSCTPGKTQAEAGDPQTETRGRGGKVTPRAKTLTLTQIVDLLARLAACEPRVGGVAASGGEWEQSPGHAGNRHGLLFPRLSHALLYAFVALSGRGEALADLSGADAQRTATAVRTLLDAYAAVTGGQENDAAGGWDDVATEKLLRSVASCITSWMCHEAWRLPPTDAATPHKPEGERAVSGGWGGRGPPPPYVGGEWSGDNVGRKRAAHIVSEITNTAAADGLRLAERWLLKLLGWGAEGPRVASFASPLLLLATRRTCDAAVYDRVRHWLLHRALSSWLPAHDGKYRGVKERDISNARRDVVLEWSFAAARHAYANAGHLRQLVDVFDGDRRTADQHPQQDGSAPEMPQDAVITCRVDLILWQLLTYLRPDLVVAADASNGEEAPLYRCRFPVCHREAAECASSFTPHPGRPMLMGTTTGASTSKDLVDGGIPAARSGGVWAVPRLAREERALFCLLLADAERIEVQGHAAREPQQPSSVDRLPSSANEWPTGRPVLSPPTLPPSSATDRTPTMVVVRIEDVRPSHLWSYLTASRPDNTRGGQSGNGGGATLGDLITRYLMREAAADRRRPSAPAPPVGGPPPPPGLPDADDELPVM